jgi:hypothetical protein
MNEMPERTFTWKDHVPGTLSTILFITQIVVGVYLLPEISQIEVLAYVGVGLYVSSGMILGALPVFEFRPQYVTFIMWAFSGMLLFQHWIVILLGVPIIPLTYVDLFREDKACVERFGEDYKAYMKRVPRANFLLGVIRRFRRSGK